ncbi:MULTISPECIES: hypothetical protein [Pseudanabaena]|jgi:hypothetical protein|uniref:hypothetical protein n=1 Tax=Pseudanabaena TaxID=1152 RepID=UPI002479B9C7|nr:MULTISPECIES: hypothetical protein [Pseudanabaena]MEA5489454.1 hypothetical protein [Pseudanabaena sp. CCNP1317]WGS71527.1 hypothetical protein OA858_17690 [Pseudanabaena galeata CCNP1313]
MIVFLDSGVIGLLSNPNKRDRAIACEDWLYGLFAKGVYVVSSDICDYEVRRNLVLESMRFEKRLQPLTSLDELHDFIDFLPVTSKILISASDVWAKSRLQGQAMSNAASIDVDAIICAHWELLKEEFPSRYVVIATTNVRHLSRFTEAFEWESIQL